MKNTVLAIALGVMGLCAAHADNHAAVTKPTFSASRTIAVSAEVVSIDLESRQVTLRNRAGEEFSIVVGEEARNLAEVAPGDQVLGELVEEVNVKVFDNPEGLDPGAGQMMTEGRAKEGSMPGGVLIDEAVITAVVDQIDLERNTFRLRGPAGNVREFTAKNPENLRRAAVGDLVVITVSRAVGVVVKRPTAQ
jgi:hypothetical protein